MFMDIAALPADPLVGTRYRVIRLLSGGSTADVYEAAGPRGELCAIKVLRIRDSQEAAARLLQEGRVLAAIRHPNLVPLREIGMTRDGRPFLAMPRLEGETLRHALHRKGALSPALAVSIVIGALDGLHAAHRRGVIHRDVKPTNLFLEKTHADALRPLMLDFGIAKVAGSAACRTTDSDYVRGTPRYIAPEQILGGRVDARTDVYSMGVLLFESIAARGPFDVIVTDSFVSILRAHVGMLPRRLDEVAPVSPALARVVARALQKSPDRRYPTAAAFATALRRVRALVAAEMRVS